MPRPRRPAPAAGEQPAFAEETLALLAQRPAGERKQLGQYFTPRAVRQRLLDRVLLQPGMRVLDPGAGTGEFLADVRERCADAIVAGCEIDASLVAICHARGLAGVVHRDALRDPPAATHDLVIGNPPYYEVQADLALFSRYHRVISGRPNVFAMFFQAGLDALRPGGRLAYVVPPSMNNGKYFEGLRQFILGQAAIESLEILEDCDLFDGARQSVMLLVLRKGERSDHCVFRADLGGAEPTPLFLAGAARLAELLAGRHTLTSLGYRIATGRCVWNQRKDDLRREPSGETVPLIWAHNIRSGRLAWADDHPKRPQYLVHPQPDVGPAIVVNRVTGQVGRGGLRAALVPAGLRFVAENHVNVIQRVRDCFTAEPPDHGEALDAAVLRELLSERTTEALRLITGNTQLSSRELRALIPLMARA